MTIAGVLCLLIGALIALIFGVQLLIIAFRESILWGLGYLFIPFVGLIFVLMYWSQTKKPFLMSLISIPFFLIGGFLVSSSLPASYE